ncbi:MAG: choice-of-anchor I family protein [Gammaproteobacteria bacterium]
MRKTTLAAAIGCVLAAGPAAAVQFDFNHYWTFSHTAGNGSAALTAEIVAYDSHNARLWVAGPSGVDILDPLTRSLASSIDTLPFGETNSVAVSHGLAAIAIADSIKTNPGTVRFYDAASYAFTTSVGVGALPDMVTFTPDGSRVLTANEGEPNSYGQPDSIDPDGTVSIIDTTTFSVDTVGFGGFTQAAIEAAGGRVFGPGASVAQDLEPEYVAVAPDGSYAWVTLQEANALARIDLNAQANPSPAGATPVVTTIKGLGYKDHSLPGNALDPSDRDVDGGDPEIDIQNFPVKGMYMPDAIGTYETGGNTYFVIANEGDAREYTGFEEEARIKELNWDPASPVASLLADEDLGRLTVTTTLGDVDNDGDYDEAYAFGGRSFSILDADGNLVFDSGDLLEQIIADEFPALWQEGRSDNKGPEPEGIALAEVAGRDLLFLGLERTNATMVFDISNPVNALFLAVLETAGDVGPEGLTVFEMAGEVFVAIANEVSGTTTLYNVSAVPVPAALPLAASALGMLGAWRRRRVV